MDQCPLSVGNWGDAAELILWYTIETQHLHARGDNMPGGYGYALIPRESLAKLHMPPSC